MLVVKVRINTRIGLGSKENEKLTRQMRVQANFLENLLPFAILYILIELNNASVILLHITGGSFLVARLIHAYGFSKASGRSFGRYYGTLLSWISQLVLIAVNLYQSIMILV